MCLAKAHSLTHVREKPYQCTAPGCGYTAWKSQSLDKHMKTHMGTESSRATSHKLAEQSVDEQQGGDYSQDESIFKCAISGCNYESRVGTEFEAHMWTHTMATYECKVPDCHCKLSSLDLLNSHMLLHCDMFLLQCEVPGCRFVGKQTRCLKQHMYEHANLVHHICNAPGCGYSTMRKGDLKKHMRIHSNAKSYWCNVPGCGYKSRCMGDLNAHMRRVHTCKKSLLCKVPQCGHIAGSDSALRAHMQMHIIVQSKAL